MRKVLIGAIASGIAVGVIVVGAVGIDYGTSIYAEYRLSSTVRKAAHLGSDPFVAILAFPFIPQALTATTTNWKSRPTPSITQWSARPRWKPRCTRST